MGGAAGQPLLRRSVPVAVLLAGAVRRSERRRRSAGEPRVVRRRAELVAGEVDLVLAGAADPGVSRQLPVHLLLLPQGVLSLVRRLTAGLRGRAARRRPAVPRRDRDPAGSEP